MKGRPGSASWLLGHELRLAWYTTLASGKPDTPRRPNWRILGSGLLVWIFLHLGSFALLHAMGKAGGPPAHGLLVGLSAMVLTTWLFMLSSALKASVETLFDRGDMDLLLSSPLPSRSIFTVKLIGMTASVAMLYLFFLAPFAHVGMLLGQFRWLSMYPLLLGMAALAASAAMLLTLALVRVLGARRTRVVAQVVGALAGALLFLLSQVGTFMAQGDEGGPPSALAQVMSATSALDHRSLLLLPARAALGDVRALCLVAALAVMTVLLTIRLTHGFFVRGLQQAAGIGQVRKRTGTLRFRFDRSLAGVVIVKEWRLIARDPQLISQVLMQLLYLLPLCFIMFRNSGIQLPATGAGLTMLSGSLSAALAWIILMAEDAPDLLHTAPAGMGSIQRAKIAAAALPVLALVALPVLWLALQAPTAGLLIGVTVCGSIGSSVLITLWTGRPKARGEFTSRHKRSVATALLEVCNLLAWGALAVLVLNAIGSGTVDMFFAAGIGAAAAIALGLTPLAFLLRHRRR